MFYLDLNSILYAGITGVIVGGIITYYSQKKIQKSICENNNKLEIIKHELNLTSYRSNTFFESKFELYNELWESLMEVKLDASALWDSVNKENLTKFSKSLEILKMNIEKKRLLIEEEDYNQIKIIISRFDNYRANKKELFKLKSNFSEADFERITEIISHNREDKQDYELFIEQIYPKLRSEIKGISKQSPKVSNP